jgi:hypothetical protein
MSLESGHEKNNNREAIELLYKQYNVSDMFLLNKLYISEEQPLFRAGTWSYEDHGQIHNQIKDALEKISIESLTEEEVEWRSEILWFWYHHAISVAINHNSKEYARYFANKALEVRSENHPNKITDILHALVYDNPNDAKLILEKMKLENNPDIEVAKWCIESYEDGTFWPNKI